MTSMEISRILDKKDAKYLVIGDIMYIANEFLGDTYIIRVRFNDGKYISHRANYDMMYEHIDRRGCDWDASHHRNVLHSGLTANVSHNLQSLLEAIDR